MSFDFNSIAGAAFGNIGTQLGQAASVATGLGINQLLNQLPGANFGFTIDPTTQAITQTPLNAITPQTAQQTVAENSAFSLQDNSTLIVAGVAAVGALALIFIK